MRDLGGSDIWGYLGLGEVVFELLTRDSLIVILIDLSEPGLEAVVCEVEISRSLHELCIEDLYLIRAESTIFVCIALFEDGISGILFKELLSFDFSFFLLLAGFFLFNQFLEGFR